MFRNTKIIGAENRTAYRGYEDTPLNVPMRRFGCRKRQHTFCHGDRLSLFHDPNTCRTGDRGITYCSTRRYENMKRPLGLEGSYMLSVLVLNETRSRNPRNIGAQVS